ncbi:MAG TPA: phosphotransferase [Ktedonobacterales bacterium]|jgi:Ser/Thr protein kinase RdoA (MazF antagonist)
MEQGALPAEVLAEAREALVAWKLKDGAWRLVGTVPGSRGAVLRPVVEIGDTRYALRRQTPNLTLADARFRHAFMAHLTVAGLPVPSLLPAADGHTWALVDDGVYELQTYLDGHPYLSSGVASSARLEAAAVMLGQLHQASADFSWEPHVWPEERSAASIASSYVNLIADAAENDALSSDIRHGLARVAEGCAARVEQTSASLQMADTPQLHIHGDYQPHHLAFAEPDVSAIYDFDAARYDLRLIELAYSLLYFTGLRWDERDGLTPPLVDDGLDILAAHRYLRAYGSEAPPAPGEAAQLADALALVFPIAFSNGAAEDIVFASDFEGAPDEEDALQCLEWADAFWLWLDRSAETLAQAWESGA